MKTALTLIDIQNDYFPGGRKPLEGEFVVVKHSPNGFLETSLLVPLRELEVERLVAAGMMTHMFADATVRAASDPGFEVWLAQDGCASRDLVFEGETIPAACVQKAFLAALQSTFASVMPTSEILERQS